jgi:hypothetical protein
MSGALSQLSTMVNRQNSGNTATTLSTHDETADEDASSTASGRPKSNLDEWLESADVEEETAPPAPAPRSFFKQLSSVSMFSNDGAGGERQSVMSRCVSSPA